MPIKGNWKKPFAAALKAARDSKAVALKECVAQIFRLARTDSIIYGGTKAYPRKNGSGTWLYYLEKPEMNRYMGHNRKNKKLRRVYHQTKFVSRTGDLAKSLTPAGGWTGNTLKTRGEGEAVVNENESCAIMRFTGRAEAALRGGDSKLAKNKVELTDANGSVITQTEHGRRRPIELACRKVKRVFEKTMKLELDKRTGGMK
jgi:hypothetical protein